MHLVKSNLTDNMSASFTSSYELIEACYDVSVQIRVDNNGRSTGNSTGTAAGDIYIEVSNSYVPAYAADLDDDWWWDALELSGSLLKYTVASGTDLSKFVWIPGGVAAKALRVRYVRSSGNGILDVITNLNRMR